MFQVVNEQDKAGMEFEMTFGHILCQILLAEYGSLCNVLDQKFLHNLTQ